MEPCVPPGFRFYPTEEELVGYYLKKKVASEKIDLDVIRDIDLYRIEPWDIQDLCRIGYEEQRDWYFFSHKDKKYPTGTRTNRATLAGFWKATGRDKAIYDKSSSLIGMRKTLVFYKGRAPNGQKTDWIMHEYRLESEENGPPQEEGWVVCRAFKKQISCQTRGIEAWNYSIYCYDEPTGINSITNSTHCHLPSPQAQKFACKQETQLHDFNLLCSDHFLQLPELAELTSPLLSPENEGDHRRTRDTTSNCTFPSVFYRRNNAENVTTDWRALHKFVASQLIQEDRCEGTGTPPAEFAVDNSSEMEMAQLFLQSSRDEGSNRLNGFLSSGSVRDSGICILDN